MNGEIKVEVIDLTEDIDEVNVKAEVFTPEKENHSLSDPGGESCVLQQSPSKRLIRNIDKCLDKAVADIKKGQSLVLVASHYGIPQDVLYNKLISRSLPRETEILTQTEEENLIKWILKSNQNNILVFKQQLMEKVGKLKKVMSISPIFGKSKFGRMWYEYFMKTHPEIYENDGLLMPLDKVLVRSSPQDDLNRKQVTQPPDLNDLDILTPDEEDALVNWIITSNRQNCIVFKNQLMKKVCRQNKVAKSTPGFAKSKFGKLWYDRFLKKHPEIYENDELLLPSENEPHPSAVCMAHGIQDSLVILHDFRKDTNSPFRLVKKDTYVLKKSENHLDQNKKIMPQEGAYIQGINNLRASESDTDILGNALGNKTTEDVLQTIEDGIPSDESGIESDHGSSESIKDISYLPYKNIKKGKRESKLPGEKPVCHKCVKSFCNLSKLKRHMLSKHPTPENSQLMCYNCKKVFPSKIRLQTHMRDAHRTTYFSCDECGKPFKFKTSMRKHQRTIHEGLDVSYERFFCDICEKGFKYKNSLECHIIYGHLKEKKKFSCDVCKKTFIRHSLMLRHRTRHSKIKPMECIHCGKTYSRKYIMREHIKKCPKFRKLKKITDAQ